MKANTKKNIFLTSTILLFIFGIFLINDAILSIIYRQDHSWIYQPGRYIRGIIGGILIALSIIHYLIVIFSYKQYLKYIKV